MEDLLKFSHSLELSRDTRKLILDMIRSIKSMFPSNPVITERANGVNYSVVADHVAEILETAREKPEIFDGIIDPDELEKYSRSASEFGEIGNQIEKLLNAVRDYQVLANYLTYSLAVMIKEHLEMMDPEGIKSLNEKISETGRPSSRSFGQIKANLKVV
jgi:hypothetical protein